MMISIIKTGDHLVKNRPLFQIPMGFQMIKLNYVFMAMLN